MSNPPGGAGHPFKDDGAGRSAFISEAVKKKRVEQYLLSAVMSAGASDEAKAEIRRVMERDMEERTTHTELGVQEVGGGGGEDISGKATSWKQPGGATAEAVATKLPPSEQAAAAGTSEEDDSSRPGDLGGDMVDLSRRCENGFAETFPQRLLAVLSRTDTAHCITWSPDGQSFLITSPRCFCNDLLPKYFKQTKFASFTRKLNRWGFKRVTKGPNAGAYFHSLFQRDNPDLCLRMRCQKIRTHRSDSKKVGTTQQQEDMTAMATMEDVSQLQHMQYQQQQLPIPMQHFQPLPPSPSMSGSNPMSPSLSFQPHSQQQQQHQPASFSSPDLGSIPAASIPAAATSRLDQAHDTSLSDAQDSLYLSHLLAQQQQQQTQQMQQQSQPQFSTFGTGVGTQYQDLLRSATLFTGSIPGSSNTQLTSSSSGGGLLSTTGTSLLDQQASLLQQQQQNQAQQLLELQRLQQQVQQQQQQQQHVQQAQLPQASPLHQHEQYGQQQQQQGTSVAAAGELHAANVGLLDQWNSVQTTNFATGSMPMAGVAATQGGQVPPEFGDTKSGEAKSCESGGAYTTAGSIGRASSSTTSRKEPYHPPARGA